MAQQGAAPDLIDLMSARWLGRSPVIALVIFVAIKTPDAADNNEATDAVVPKIAQIMEAEIGASVGAFESNVIVNHELGQPNQIGRWFRLAFSGRGCVITKRAQFPFRVDDAAIVG